MTQNEPVVGWIGFGDQGLPMATAIAEQGFRLHAWARRPSSLEPLAVDHVRHDDLSRLAAESDIVGICVGTDDDVMDLLRRGLLDGLRPGSVVVNHGTGTPANAREFADECFSAQVNVLDAPVSGGRPAALERQLITMVGGPAESVTLCRPVFESFSRDVIHLGGTGAGQTAKLFNNALMITNQAAIADVLELASASGVDTQGLFRILREASAGSTVLNLFATMIRADTVGHLAAVQSLDIDLFDEAMREAGVDAAAVTARARSGNDRLAEVVRVLSP